MVEQMVEQMVEEDKNIIKYIKTNNKIQNGINASFYLSNNPITLDDNIALIFRNDYLSGLKLIINTIKDVIEYYFPEFDLQDDYYDNNAAILYISTDTKMGSVKDMDRLEFLSILSIFAFQLDIWGNDFINRIKDNYGLKYLIMIEFKEEYNILEIIIKKK
jgi:hypothetical protein